MRGALLVHSLEFTDALKGREGTWTCRTAYGTARALVRRTEIANLACQQSCPAMSWKSRNKAGHQSLWIAAEFHPDRSRRRIRNELVTGGPARQRGV